jgi:hypothetical protein
MGGWDQRAYDKGGPAAPAVGPSSRLSVPLRPLAGLWRWLKWMFLAFLTSMAAALFITWAAWATYDPGVAEGKQADLAVWTSYTAWGFIALTQVLLSASNFLFLRLFFRALRNARVLAPETVTRSPGWTVAWNFVPVANIIRPVGAMAQIWRASRPDGPLPRAFFLWWTAWVTYWITYVPLTAMQGMRGAAIEFLGGAETYAAVGVWLNTISSIALVLAVLFAMIFLPGLVRLQDGKMQAVAFE